MNTVTHDPKTGRPIEHARGFGDLVREEAQPQQFYTVSQMIADLKAGKFQRPTLKPELPVGTTVHLVGLVIDAEIVKVQPPTVAGGLTKFRCRWWEPALQAHREANFWRQDFEVVETKTASR